MCHSLRVGLSLLALASTCLAHTPRRVRWYVSAGRTQDNIDFAKANPDALTGFYGCCNLLAVDNTGSVSLKFENLSSISIPHKAALSPSKTMSFHAVISVNKTAILSGSALHAVEPLAMAAESGGVDGLICDYEPDSNYTIDHVHKYVKFLRALKASLEARGLELGVDVAGWGILDKLDEYNGSAHFFTSMSPTYNANNLTVNREFVTSMLSAFGAESVSVGMGSMMEPGDQSKCSHNFGYTNETLMGFLEFLAEKGVSDVDIWKCDIDNYGTTASWFVNALTSFEKDS